MRGALVVLEGAEGVGKTTQVQRVAAALRRAGRLVTVVREPGGTPLGDDVRRLLLDAAHPVGARAEALLFMASRAQLVDDVVAPALARGHWVLTDRFFLSTYAYQAAGRGIDEGSVRALNAFATGGVVPDLTILIDLPAGDGMARAAARGAPDRVERSGADFHARVADAFREFAAEGWQRRHPECGPIELVDGRGTEEEVEGRLVALIARRLDETFPHPGGSNTP